RHRAALRFRPLRGLLRLVPRPGRGDARPVVRRCGRRRGLLAPCRTACRPPVQVRLLPRREGRVRPDPQIVAELKGAGVAIGPGVLPREEALALRPLLQRAIDEDLVRWKDAPGYLDAWMVHNLMVRGRPFLHLLENPVLHAYLGELLSDTCIVYAYTS